MLCKYCNKVRCLNKKRREKKKPRGTGFSVVSCLSPRLLAALGFPAFSARSTCLKTAKLRRLGGWSLSASFVVILTAKNDYRNSESYKLISKRTCLDILTCFWKLNHAGVDLFFTGYQGASE